MTIAFISMCITTYAQAGSDCNNAVGINAIPYNNTNLTTCGKGNDYNANNSVCPSNYQSGRDFVFEFTPQIGEECISIYVDPKNGANAGLFVTKGCPDVNGSICVAQASNPDQDENTIESIQFENLLLEVGETYYIVLDAWNRGINCYDFDINITTGSCTPTPPGSDCETAVEINGMPYSDANSTCPNKDFITDGVMCQAGYPREYGNGTGKEYVYKYTPAQDECVEMMFETSGIGSKLVVFEGCPSLELNACYRAFAVDTSISHIFSLNGGTEYYFVLSSDKDYSECVDFTFEAKLVDDQGSTCANAYPINGIPFFADNHTTFCKGYDYANEGGCNSNGAFGEDVVFEYTATQDACLSINIDDIKQYGRNNDGWPVVVFVYDNCPDNGAVNCLGFGEVNPWNTKASAGVSFDAQAGQQYYFVVSYRNNWNYANSGVIFDLTLTENNPSENDGETCASAYNIANIPYSKTDVTTSCRTADYSGDYDCSTDDEDYFEGNDVVFEYTATEDICLKIVANNITGEGGIYVVDDCPDNNPNCFGSMLCDGDCDSIYMETTLQAGETYYIVGASKANASEFNFDININTLQNDGACISCNDDVCIACTNAGFENGNFDGWVLSKGIYDNPTQTNVNDNSAINNPSATHAIMTAGSYDPVIGPELKTTSPNGGNFSARLGNIDVSGNHGGNRGYAETMSYSYVVDSASSNFFYYYAVVFEDPKHAEHEQPYFEVRLFDENDVEVDCGYYGVFSARSIEGFNNSAQDPDIKWRDWTLVGIPLVDYIGQQVTLQFTVRDCDRTGHFGYAYVDAFCRPIEIDRTAQLLCEDSSLVIQGPEGFAEYEWSSGETTKDITVTDTGLYQLEVTSISGCIANIDVNVTGTLNPIPNFSYQKSCEDSIITFISQATQQPGDTVGIDSLIWYIDGQRFSGDTVLFKPISSGNIDVRFEIQNAVGCISDSILSINIDQTPLPSDLTGDQITVCEFEDVLLESEVVADAVSYIWSGPNNYLDSNRTSTISPTTKNEEGYYKVDVLLSVNGVSELCKTTDSVLVLTEDRAPELVGDTIICEGESATLTASGGNAFLWSPNTNLSSTNGNSVEASPVNSTLYSVTVSFPNCPDSTMNIMVDVNEEPEELTGFRDTAICEGESVILYPDVTHEYDSIFWTGPNGFYQLNEIELQLDINKKSEQQALAKYGLDFVTNTYLPEKLKEMNILT